MLGLMVHLDGDGGGGKLCHIFYFSVWLIVVFGLSVEIMIGSGGGESIFAVDIWELTADWYRNCFWGFSVGSGGGLYPIFDSGTTNRQISFFGGVASGGG